MDYGGDREWDRCWEFHYEREGQKKSCGFHEVLMLEECSEDCRIEMGSSASENQFFVPMFSCAFTGQGR